MNNGNQMENDDDERKSDSAENRARNSVPNASWQAEQHPPKSGGHPNPFRDKNFQLLQSISTTTIHTRLRASHGVL